MRSAPLVDGFDVPLFVGEPGILESLTGYHLHRGAIASMHRPPMREVHDVIAEARRIVVLEDIVDHTNVGAIFRSVAGLGADAVLVTPRCADPLYRRSVRVSMGTVLQVPWTRLPDWPGGAELLRADGFHIAALALRGWRDRAGRVRGGSAGARGAPAGDRGGRAERGGAGGGGHRRQRSRCGTEWTR